MMHHSSSLVTSLRDDKLQSVVGWIGGGEPSAACQMSKILVVCYVRKYSAEKARAPEMHSGWTLQRPNRVLNEDHRQLDSFAWVLGNDRVLAICLFLPTIFTVHTKHKLNTFRSV